MLRLPNLNRFVPLVLAVSLATTGCDASGDDLPREPVSGTVTLDGQPLESGAIQFIPAKNAGGVAVTGGGTVENGLFSIGREHGLVPGSYKVSINAAEPEKAEKRTKGGVRKKAAMIKDLIPPKYNSATKLQAEIEKGGSNRLTFDLQSN